MEIVIDARVIQDHFPGIGRYTYNLLAALSACLSQGEQLTILHDPSVKNSHYDLSRLAAPNARLLDYRTTVFSLRNLSRFPHLPAGNARSVFHFPYYLRPYLSVRPTVTTIHDLISLVYPQFFPSWRTRLSIRVFNWLAIRSSQAIIAVSQSTARDIAHLFPSARNKVKVVYEAPDSLFAPQSPERIQAVRARYDLSSPFVLSLSSNKPHKNLPGLIDAWKQANIADSNPIYPMLVIAGHQDARLTSQRTAHHDRRDSSVANVRFLGEVPGEDVPALYAACEFFVFPSLYEGFGLPPLEAMACGAAVACSNASSLPEVTGDAAILFDPHHPDEMIAACRRILSDAALRDDLRRRSLQRAATFTWAETARRTLDIYRELVNRSTG